MILRAAPFAVLLGISVAHANDFTTLGSLSQDEFHGLAKDLGAAMSYKGVTPATALGPVGFDIGVEVTDTKLENSAAFSRAGAGSPSHLVMPKLHVYKGLFGGLDIGVEVTDTKLENSAAFSRAGAGSPSHLVMPKLHVYKGLFGGLDIGAFVAGASEVNATFFGADLRYAILDDTLVAPAVAVRLSGTKASGMGELTLATGALDIMVSKKFTALTPYLGAGAVRVQAKARGSGLAQEHFNESRVFGGLNVNLVGVNFAVEAERTGPNTSLSAKVGLRF